MSASKYYRKLFTKKSLKELYYSSVRFKSAVGIDRVNTRSFERNLSKNIGVINRKVNNGSYRFSQYREKLLSRGQNKLPRVVSIPTFRDKLTQKALFEVLLLVFEDSLPFLHKIINEIITILKSGTYDSVIRLDVKDFYPSLRHDLLLNQIKKKIKKKEILTLIQDAISQQTVPKPKADHKLKTKIGVPQGLSISNILANVYMYDLDAKYSGKTSYKYFRYVDDILILCDSADIDTLLKKFNTDCKAMGLDLHSENEDSAKASVAKISGGFYYLGYFFNSELITVRKKSIDHLRESIIKHFTQYKYVDTKDLKILKWNIDLRITGCIFENTKFGWLFFFSQIDDLSLLSSLNHFIKNQCKRFGIVPSEANLKNFVRAYHEIRSNLRNTKYIPNFDNFSISEKRRILRDVFSLKLDLMSEGDINYQFKKRIYRTVKDLEKDLARTS